MDNEIELIADQDGIALIGDATAIDRHLAAEGLESRDLELHRVRSVLQAASAATTTASEVAANSGRWVKLTEKSAEALKHGDLIEGSGDGVGRAVIMKDGKTSHILEIVKTPGATLANPALLSGAAGLMAQMAMQQTMDQITHYLATIDEKVDDVLRAQKDKVLADMTGVEFAIQEALTIRAQVGRVSEVTWSKVQATSYTIASTQSYALRQLDGLASDLEKARNSDAIAERARRAESTVQEWLAVLAKCFQLQDAVAVLELDRVLDTDPHELDLHRLALRIARQARLDLIVTSAQGLMSRMDAAAHDLRTNPKVLRHPRSSRAIVQASNELAAKVDGLYEQLAVGQGREQLVVRRWREAAGDVGARAVDRGAAGVESVRRVGASGATRARATAGDLRERAARRRAEQTEVDAPDGSGPTGSS